MPSLIDRAVGVALWPVTAIAAPAERAALSLVDSLLASRFLDQIVERVLDDLLEGDALENAIARALESPAVERAVEGAVNSPGMQRIVAQVIDSRLLDEAVARLLESRDLWILVDEIAQSPAVTQAISHQSVGFAEQVAGDVRERSRHADARLERTARRLFRRAPAP